MAFVFGILLALVSMALLARPILKGGQPAPGPLSLLDSLEEVRRRRQRIYDEIATLALDYELGNIRGREYEEELSAHRLRAAYALREQDRLQQALASLNEELEDEALKLRKSWGTVRGVAPCGTCGREMDLEAVVCPRCALSQEGDMLPEEGGRG